MFQPCKRRGACINQSIRKSWFEHFPPLSALPINLHKQTFGGDQLGAFWRTAVQKHHLRMFGHHQSDCSKLCSWRRSGGKSIFLHSRIAPALVIIGKVRGHSIQSVGGPAPRASFVQPACQPLPMKSCSSR
jgi:hypothetical protein